MLDFALYLCTSTILSSLAAVIVLNALNSRNFGHQETCRHMSVNKLTRQCSWLALMFLCFTLCIREKYAALSLKECARAEMPSLPCRCG